MKETPMLPPLPSIYHFYTTSYFPFLLNSALSFTIFPNRISTRISRIRDTQKEKIKTLVFSSISGERCVVGGEFACFARVWFWWWSPSGWYSGSECSSMDSTRSKTLSVSAILAAAPPPAEEDPSSVMHRRHCSSSPFSCSISLLLIVLGICLFPFIN